MNKNRFLNILFFSLNGAFAIFLVLNFIFNFLKLEYLLALFFILNSIYLFFKFILYYSDSGLFFGSFNFLNGIFVIITTHFNLGLLKLFSFIFLSFVCSCFFIFCFFKSSYFFYAFFSGFLIFFPIIFYSFNVIDLKNFFIFISSCVIINLFLYFILIKSVKRN